MAYEVEVPEEYSTGGNFLEAPGTYHFLITEVKEGQGPSGKMIDGFTVALQVLAGTVDGQADKTLSMCFFNPKLSSKDQGNFARQKNSCFLISVDLLAPNVRGQRVSVDLQEATNRQIVATVELDDQSSDDGKKFLSLAYSNVFHVDDPRAASYPKSEQALGMIPKELRHEASYFDSLTKKSGDGSKGSSGQTTKSNQPSGSGDQSSANRVGSWSNL